ncbi:hypothetical protein DFP72DRAFT_913761 [Ephemerocybe angulata]|uniref:F-box domain-containing protein n=1 Tax=Ephemerocybe angulata TaxID=980116 RepID=A0A8H6HMB2_9AGAR|nr:hypothetical protein DFP72DRAFT_913761 [Tulosesus angulatus]
MSVKDTPFLEHLDTNYAPTEEELPVLRNIIQENEEILTDLDAQIQALNDVRKARADFIQRHFALLSPLKRLPDDLLSTLFLALLNHPDNRHAKMSNTHPAVVLSHVCRRWRQLALDTALLWTALRIYPPVLPQGYPYGSYSANPHLSSQMTTHSPRVEVTRRWEKEVEKILTMTRVWLKRSKECTLTIDVHAPDVAPQIYPNHPTAVDVSPKAETSGLTALIEAVCDASRRWKIATLRVSTTRLTSSDSPFRRIFTLTEDDVPLLQELIFSVNASFGIHHEEGSLIPPHRETGMLGGRSLRSVTLGPMCVDINTLPIRWGQLTDIQFNGYINVYTPFPPGDTGPGLSFDCTQALNLLRLCPRLVNCDLSLVPYSRPLESFGTVSLPDLKSLTLRYSVPDIGFISCLQASSLRKLVLPNFLDMGLPNEHAGESPGSSLIAWLEAYGHQLTEIQFNVSTLTPAGLRTVMDLLPNIKTLRLDHNGDGASLPPTPNGDQVLPMPAMVDELFLGQFMPEREDQRNDEPRGPLWCPNLESIRFPRRGGTTFTEQDFLEFVAARRRMHSEGKVGQLREVTVMFGILQEGDLMARLEEMGVDVEGLTLKISYASRIPLRPEQVYPREEYDF